MAFDLDALIAASESAVDAWRSGQPTGAAVATGKRIYYNRTIRQSV
jgi:hypothetical protein